ncbi:Uncharacterised protein [Chryseobacterium nakagawai]|uniref:Uncharacterized protein n=1 Tax=Chryseobacterium nakagawai TaxID=1241982 RepID=A0AAD1DQM5_CHRNA|nr:hypothetical protein [Chryseobacterium nakagawai]AZA90933.1 hypothetical protein EG343_09940 [Chryseobacterium nakagawai]VEH22471.1 Uncharacterised protein [Chryseobacterium nakagawai]
MKAFYSKLVETFEKDEIKNEYSSNGLDYPKFIDLYGGQDLGPESFDIYPYPAIFVTWSIDHRQNPSLVTVTFRLCFEQYRDTSSLGRNTEEALKFLDYIEMTDRILRKFESPDTGKLEPATEELNIEPIVTDQYILVYNCSYKNKKITPDSKGEYKDITVKSGLYTKIFD